jgi:hypothetical protein
MKNDESKPTQEEREVLEDILKLMQGWVAIQEKIKAMGGLEVCKKRDPETYDNYLCVKGLARLGPVVLKGLAIQDYTTTPQEVAMTRVKSPKNEKAEKHISDRGSVGRSRE